VHTVIASVGRGKGNRQKDIDDCRCDKVAESFDDILVEDVVIPGSLRAAYYLLQNTSHTNAYHSIDCQGKQDDYQ
jgi:hypothetical protein